MNDGLEYCQKTVGTYSGRYEYRYPAQQKEEVNIQRCHWPDHADPRS